MVSPRSSTDFQVLDFRNLLMCIYLIKSYVNLDANWFQPSGCSVCCLACFWCWKSLRTTVAPRETFKRVIPLLFFLVKVIMPQPSLNHLLSSEGKVIFPSPFPLATQNSCRHCLLKMSLAGPLVRQGAPGLSPGATDLPRQYWANIKRHQGKKKIFCGPRGP